MRCTVIGALVLAGCGSSSGGAPDGADPPPADAAVDGPVAPDGEDVWTGLASPLALAVDDTHLYVSLGGDTIVRRALGGGALETLATGRRYAGGLDVSTDRLYWIDHGTHAVDFLDGSVNAVAKTGGTTQQLAPAYMPTALVLEGHAVYWAEGDGERVQRVGIDGTGQVVVDQSPGFRTGLAIAPTSIYWATSTGVAAMDRATEEVAPIATGEYGVWSIEEIDGDLFWTAGLVGSEVGTVRVSRSGGAPVDLVADEYGLTGVVADGGYLYWTSGDEIRRIAAAGGTVETFAAGVPGATALAFDDTHVYWTDMDRGAVVRKPR
jgi:hypothetical protein